MASTARRQECKSLLLLHVHDHNQGGIPKKNRTYEQVPKKKAAPKNRVVKIRCDGK